MVSFALPIMVYFSFYFFTFLYDPLDGSLNAQYGLRLPTGAIVPDFDFTSRFFNPSQCPAGTYQSAIYNLNKNYVSQPLQIMLNFFNINVNSIPICTTCPPGTCCPNPGLKTPQACPLGYYCPGGSISDRTAPNNCKEHSCPEGNTTKIINGTGAYSSSQCYSPCTSNQCEILLPTSSFTCVNKISRTSTCLAGYTGLNTTSVVCSRPFTTTTVSSGCTSCSPGKFSNGTLPCQNCTTQFQTSRICNGIGTQTINYTCDSTIGTVISYGKCVNCTTGSYILSNSTSATCTLCSPGTFSNTFGQSSCATCNTNTTCTGLNRQALTYSCNTTQSILITNTSCNCSPGNYFNSGFGCISCGVGSYSDGTTSICTQCPSQLTTIATGSTSASQCVCPLNAIPNGEICTPCISGTSNPGDQKCTCSLGFKLSSSNNYTCEPVQCQFTVNINGSCPLIKSYTLNPNDFQKITCGDNIANLQCDSSGKSYSSVNSIGSAEPLSPGNLLNCTSTANCVLTPDPYGTYNCSNVVSSNTTCIEVCNSGFTSPQTSTCMCDGNGGTKFTPDLGSCKCLSPNIQFNDGTCGQCLSPNIQFNDGTCGQCSANITANGVTTTLNTFNNINVCSNNVQLTCNTSGLLISGTGYTSSPINNTSANIACQCPMGSKLNSNGLCQPCPVGTYTVDGTTCTSCPTGTTTSNNGSTTIDDCKCLPNYVPVNGNSSNGCSCPDDYRLSNNICTPCDTTTNFSSDTVQLITNNGYTVTNNVVNGKNCNNCKASTPVCQNNKEELDFNCDPLGRSFASFSGSSISLTIFGCGF
jgi:hypothetical protein